MSEAEAPINDPALASGHGESPQRPAAHGVANELIEIGKTIFYALAIALVLRIFLFQPYTIPSESMMPNLLKNDYIIVSKFSYGWSRHSIPFSPDLFGGRIMGNAPHRGDIVVFKLPRDGNQDYIKRVIGMPGDSIQVIGGVVYINGKPNQQQPLTPQQDAHYPAASADYGGKAEHLTETNPDGKKYVIADWGPGHQADDTAVYTVPKGCYFVMGDNRDDSADSRFDPGYDANTAKNKLATCAWDNAYDIGMGTQELGVGFVPFEDLEGRAQVILASWQDGVSPAKPWTWLMVRPSRFFKSLR